MGLSLWFPFSSTIHSSNGIRALFCKHESDQVQWLPTTRWMKIKVFTLAYIMNILTPAYLSDLEPSFPFFDHTPDIWPAFCSAFKPVVTLAVSSSWNDHFLPLLTARSLPSLKCPLHWHILKEAFFGQIITPPPHVIIVIITMTVTFVNLGSTYCMLGIIFSALHTLTHLIIIITTWGATKGPQSLPQNFGALCVLEFRLFQIIWCMYPIWCNTPNVAWGSIP